ncbi:hypothetical protein SmJEL517_g00739 [Synchytrium microbalum]|uniref:Sfi1 spindle body domain-containing protein n=1 Tax=Synchytrium microbalum TaxID=1806994 RepID=A0A507CDJ9_9FUNG|nr:uncharacterized protein SmJEL517_g00739 [Synchytrium microbalum]TPX37692.1 hypothetical protein SmJEL517_g00739 [Synchytrium microbalum]
MDNSKNDPSLEAALATNPEMVSKLTTDGTNIWKTGTPERTIGSISSLVRSTKSKTKSATKLADKQPKSTSSTTPSKRDKTNGAGAISQNVVSDSEQLDTKEHVLALKYSRLWRSNIRRVKQTKLSESRYTTKLITNCMQLWKHALVEKRMLWRAEVRARVHYKIAICGKVWKAWRLYVSERSGKAVRRKMISEHVGRARTKRAWNAWMMYMSQKKDKVARQKAAIAFCHECVLSLYYGLWHALLVERKSWQKLEQDAASWKSHRLVKSSFRNWRLRFVTAQLRQTKMEQASHHHQRHRKNIVLHSWLAYVSKCQEKKRRTEKAVLWMTVKLRKRFFAKWKLSHMQILIREDAEKYAISWDKKRTLRTGWLIWKTHLSTVRKNNAATEKAMVHHHLVLKRHGLMAFVSLLSDGMTADKKLAADVTSQTNLDLLDDSASAVMSAQRNTGAGKGARILSNVAEKIGMGELDGFRWRVPTCKETTALAHRRKVVLKAAFSSIVEYARNRKIKRGRMDVGITVSTKRRLIKSWVLWKTLLHDKRDDVVKMRKAERLFTFIILRRTFSTLRQNAVNVTVERHYEELAKLHYNRRLALVVLIAWWNYAAQSSAKMIQWRVAVRHRYKSLLRHALRTWAQAYTSRCTSAAQWSLAVTRHLRTISKKALQAWMLYSSSRRWIHNTIQSCETRRSEILSMQLFRHWKAKTIIAREVRLEVEKAQQEGAFALIRQAFFGWRSYVEGLKLYREEQDRQVRRVQVAVEKAKLKNALAAWRRYRRYKQFCHAMNARAKSHLTRHLLSITMTFWIKRNHHRKWLHRAQSLADTFLHRNILRQSVIMWRSHRTNWNEIKSHMFVMPVLHRGQMLLGKTFSAWSDYVASKKDTRARIKEAECWRREMAIKHGILALLTVADPNRSREPLKRANAPSGITMRKWSIVEKCARHWLDVTMRARTRRRRSSANQRSALQTESRKPIPLVSSRQRQSASLNGELPPRIALPENPSLALPRTLGSILHQNTFETHATNVTETTKPRPLERRHNEIGPPVPPLVKYSQPPSQPLNRPTATLQQSASRNKRASPRRPDYILDPTSGRFVAAGDKGLDWHTSNKENVIQDTSWLNGRISSASLPIFVSNLERVVEAQSVGGSPDVFAGWPQSGNVSIDVGLPSIPEPPIQDPEYQVKSIYVEPVHPVSIPIIPIPPRPKVLAAARTRWRSDDDSREEALEILRHIHVDPDELERTLSNHDINVRRSVYNQSINSNGGLEKAGSVDTRSVLVEAFIAKKVD